MIVGRANHRDGERVADPRDLAATAAASPDRALPPDDVQDHALRVQEQLDGFRESLENILSVTLTLYLVFQRRRWIWLCATPNSSPWVSANGHARIGAIRNDVSDPISAAFAALLCVTPAKTTAGFSQKRTPEIQTSVERRGNDQSFHTRPRNDPAGHCG